MKTSLQKITKHFKRSYTVCIVSSAMDCKLCWENQSWVNIMLTLLCCLATSEMFRTCTYLLKDHSVKDQHQGKVENAMTVVMQDSKRLFSWKYLPILHTCSPLLLDGLSESLALPANEAQDYLV